MAAQEIEVYLPWDLFNIADQLGEGYPKWIQWQGVTITAGATVSAVYTVPANEVCWLVNCACSNIPANVLKYSFYIDGAVHRGQHDIIVDEAHIGKPICPPGVKRITATLEIEVENTGDGTVEIYGLIFLRVVNKWLVDLWDKRTRELLDKIRRS